MDKNITKNSATAWVKNVYSLWKHRRTTCSYSSTYLYKTKDRLRQLVQNPYLSSQLYPQNKQTYTHIKVRKLPLLTAHLYTVSTTPIITKTN